jgi:hypothetical protein
LTAAIQASIFLITYNSFIQSSQIGHKSRLMPVNRAVDSPQNEFCHTLNMVEDKTTKIIILGQINQPFFYG